MSDSAPNPKLGYAVLWFVVAFLLFVFGFQNANGPTFLAAAVVAACLGVGTLLGRMLYMLVFAPFIFFFVMFVTLQILRAFAR